NWRVQARNWRVQAKHWRVRERNWHVQSKNWHVQAKHWRARERRVFALPGLWTVGRWQAFAPGPPRRFHSFSVSVTRCRDVKEPPCARLFSSRTGQSPDTRMNRRHFLPSLAGLALTDLLLRDAALGAPGVLRGGLHHPPKARRVIQLFM